MISASKTTLNHYNLKILRLEVTKNITNLHKKFCEFHPSSPSYYFSFILIFAVKLACLSHQAMGEFQRVSTGKNKKKVIEKSPC